MDKAIIKKFTQLSPSLTILHLLEIWGTIGICLVLGYLFPFHESIINALLYGICFFIIAARQHALLVLTHDGIHCRIAKSKKINDIITQVLLGFPMFISLKKWRFIHLYHHKYTYQRKDPDVAIFARYPMEKRKFLKTILKDFLGLNLHHTYKYFTDIPYFTRAFNKRFLGEERYNKYIQDNDIAFYYIFWSLCLVGGFLFFGVNFLFYFFFYWFLPFATLLQVIIRIRGALEHGAIVDKEQTLLQTRTYLLPLYLAYFLAPKNVNYHLDHHLYPNVPFYHLKDLYDYLKEHKYKNEQACIQDIISSIKKLVRP